jgi:hypothetical protein
MGEGGANGQLGVAKMRMPCGLRAPLIRLKGELGGHDPATHARMIRLMPAAEKARIVADLASVAELAQAVLSELRR